MSRRSTKARRAARRRGPDARIRALDAQGSGDYYDQAGHPIGLGTWAWLFDQPERFLVRTKLPSGPIVSTVWLGLDHSAGGDKPPLIFETMVFTRRGGALDCYRYPTRQAAIAGHRKVVAQWRARPKLVAGETRP